ncbi:MAG TPA: prepilin-type N-terminal cleavage/methylation domain-containing protein [Gemmataceae bacterium]|nr:prepilin-type N-terminal cleavage/methylation domain-containing protein [Gemmataceae bacterium]
MRKQVRRSGFTLMEMLLAITIAVFLLFAVFTAMQMIFEEMSAGRTRMQQSSTGRAILAKMSEDIGPSLAPTLPTSTSTSSSNMNSSNNSNSNNSANSNSNSSSSATTSSTVVGTGQQLLFQIGVQGDNATCTVFQTRMARSIVNPPDNGSNGQTPYAADVWRVSYFMTGDGLVRQETRMVTSDDVDNPPDGTAVNTDSTVTKVLAAEVKSVMFQYYDGSEWQDSWDGSQPGNDGVTPMGPPMAIQVTLELAVPDSTETKTVQDVIAFPAAPGGVNCQQLQQSQQNGSGSSSGTGTSP